MRKCASCKNNKIKSEFGLNSHRKDLLNVYCKQCVREKSRAKYPNEKSRTYNPERSKKYRESKSESQKRKDSIVKRKSFLKTKYGITIEEYQIMLESQQNKCAICERHGSTLQKTLCVDHNHVTGKIRGLVCSPCNRTLGFLKIDTTDRFARNLMKYVEENL